MLTNKKSEIHKTYYSQIYVICLSLPILLSGCQPDTISSQIADGYYLNQAKNINTVGRVALVELNNDSSYPHISTDITESLYLALQKKQIFGLTVLSQDSPAWRNLQSELDSNHQIQNGAFGGPTTYTLEQLMAIRNMLKCGAILTGTITEYRPYPHMTIGIRMKLLDLTDGQLLWALEQVWDSADKKTEERIKKYFKSQIRAGFAPLQEKLVVISPLKFINFVAYEIAETLQPKGTYKR